MNGIDIYNGNDVSDFNLLKNQGVEILIHKATEGLTFKDFRLPTRYSNMKDLFKLGYYHFAKGNKPEDEAQFFLNTISGYRSDTVLWLDIEDGQYVWTKSWAIAYTNAFINYLRTKGYKVGIYTGEYFYDNYLKGSIPDDVILWIANYSKQPKTYPTHSWQYSEIGSLSGISGNVDLNNFVSDIFVDDSFVNNVALTAAKINLEVDTLGKMAQGEKSNRVRLLQAMLNVLLGTNLKIDGEFGTLTGDAVQRYQEIMNITADREVGRQTATTLYSDIENNWFQIH